MKFKKKVFKTQLIIKTNFSTNRKILYKRALKANENISNYRIKISMYRYMVLHIQCYRELFLTFKITALPTLTKKVTFSRNYNLLNIIL